MVCLLKEEGNYTLSVQGENYGAKLLDQIMNQVKHKFG